MRWRGLHLDMISAHQIIIILTAKVRGDRFLERIAVVEPIDGVETVMN